MLPPDTQTVPNRIPGSAARVASKVALVGVHGYGARHLDNLARLEQAGTAQLVAVADPNPPAPGNLGEAVQVYADLDELTASGVRPDVVVIATPIQTHAALARAALTLGCDIYLEKPPVASMAQFEQLIDGATAAGSAVQTGFQSLGSEALNRIDEVVSTGQIGVIRGISAEGQWVRTRGYFKRSRWAGKRTLDGVDVVDGVATNPLAHAVATALRVAGARSRADVLSVEADLYRAHDIESDDTTALRIRTATGQTVTCALTLCAPAQVRPSVRIAGTLGDVVFYYTDDEIEITTPDGLSVERFGRVDLLENLLRHRAHGEKLLSPLGSSGAFMTVMEAIRVAEPPRAIPMEYVSWEGSGDDAHPVVHDVDNLIQRAQRAQALFSELAPQWNPPVASNHTFTVQGTAVAEYNEGTRIAPTLAPRPYLHPVRTLGGTVVTDHMPLDHVWHLGAGVAIQDVNGVNCWGGRTYRRQAGAYVWRPDHGRILRTGAHSSDGSLQETLIWTGPKGASLMNEARQWTWDPLNETTWSLRLEFTLSTPAGASPVELGSPGSNGRAEGGYGGFFWRLPPVTESSILTADAEGESGVHGTRSAWLSFSARFGEAPATLVFVSEPGADDPWFVRSEGYPGVGLSLAWDTPVTIRPGSALVRTVTVLVADGQLNAEQVKSLVDRAGGQP